MTVAQPGPPPFPVVGMDDVGFIDDGMLLGMLDGIEEGIEEAPEPDGKDMDRGSDERFPCVLTLLYFVLPP